MVLHLCGVLEDFQMNGLTCVDLHRPAFQGKKKRCLQRTVKQILDDTMHEPISERICEQRGVMY